MMKCKCKYITLVKVSPAAVLLHAQEMRTFLALPIDKKTTHTARMMAKLKKALVEQEEEEGEEEEEKVRSLKQVKSGKVLQTPARRELKMAMMKRGDWRESKTNL